MEPSGKPRSKTTSVCFYWSVFVLFVIIIAIRNVGASLWDCSESRCGVRVSKCMLIKSCNCSMTPDDLKSQNCTCCKDCVKCLGNYFTDCCSCVGKWWLSSATAVSGLPIYVDIGIGPISPAFQLPPGFSIVFCRSLPTFKRCGSIAKDEKFCWRTETRRRSTKSFRVTDYGASNRKRLDSPDVPCSTKWILLQITSRWR